MLSRFFLPAPPEPVGGFGSLAAETLAVNTNRKIARMDKLRLINELSSSKISNFWNIHTEYKSITTFGVILRVIVTIFLI